MIVYTAGEAQHITCESSWHSHPHLEQWTGADFLISPLSLPIYSEMLIAKHLVAGGFLMNRKKGWDLINSLNDQGNLWEMLARMNEFAERHKIIVKPAQKIILGIGVVTGYVDESLKMNGQDPKGNVSYWQVAGAIERIFERGGVFTSITSDRLLAKWLCLKEVHAQSNHNGDHKYVIPKSGPMFEELAPLQPMTRVRDARIILRSFMSERQANALWEYAEQDGLAALCLAFDPLLPKMKDRPEGIGPGFVQQNRDRANAREGYVLRVIEDEYIAKEYKKIKKGAK